MSHRARKLLRPACQCRRCPISRAAWAETWKAAAAGGKEARWPFWHTYAACCVLTADITFDPGACAAVVNIASMMCAAACPQKITPTDRKQQQSPEKDTINTYFGERNSHGGRISSAGNESSSVVLSGAANTCCCRVDGTSQSAGTCQN